MLLAWSSPLSGIAWRYAPYLLLKAINPRFCRPRLCGGISVTPQEGLKCQTAPVSSVTAFGLPIGLYVFCSDVACGEIMIVEPQAHVFDEIEYLQQRVGYLSR